MTKYLETLNMKANRKAQEYCTLYNEGAKQSELKNAKKAANQAIADYNAELAIEQYLAWAEEGNPVELAVRSRVIPNALKFSFKADDDDVMGVSVKTDENYAISLPMMETVLGEEIFADPQWFNAMEKLMYLTINHINERIGNGKSDVQVEDASKAFNFPKKVNPLSDEGVIIALQAVIDKILVIKGKNKKNLISVTSGVDSQKKAFSKEWTVIRESMTAAGGVNKVQVCNTVRFCDYIVNAMHGIITNGNFKLSMDEQRTRDNFASVYNTMKEEKAKVK